MGEVYRPEDVTSLRDVQVRDITPPPRSPLSPKANLVAILRDIESIKKDITLIKQALQAHGITVE